MVLTIKQIQDIEARLVGSCADFKDVLPEGISEDDLTHEDLIEIDQRIALCEECGWWVDAGEINEEGKCEDCVA
jgi:hypothetical protein